MPFPMLFVDNVTVIPADWLNAVNNMLSSGVGSGTVTSMSGVAANGFGVSVANPTTTPAVTITCTVNGLLKGSGNALVPAVAGTDFLAPPAGNALLKANGGGALVAAAAGTDYLPGTSTLGTGILKSTAGTLSLATGADLPVMTSTVGGAVPTPPNDVAKFLRGDGLWGIPSGGGGGTGVSSITASNINGFTWTITNPTSAPNLTIAVSNTGILKGNAGGLVPAISGTDFGPPTAALATGILKSTTGTGAHSIAVAGDFPVLNQNTTGTAGGLSTTLDVAHGGTGVTTATGTGSVVLSTSPALTTPTADGFPIGYKTVPQNSQSANYTLTASDSAKHIYHPTADVTARTWTIPANASVAYPIGTELTFVNDNGAGSITIAITSDTMRLAGPGTTGSRTLAPNGVATALKITATSWIINGTGLS